jgi:hypothetical protein
VLHDRTRSPPGRRRAEATALPACVKPQLTKLVDQAPEGPEWLHELKFDGYRMHARLDRAAIRLLTRTGLVSKFVMRPAGAAHGRVLLFASIILAYPL